MKVDFDETFFFDESGFDESGFYPFSDPDEPVRHMNTMIRIRPGSAEFDVWPFPNRILDMQRSKMLAWPDEMQVEIKIHPRKRPCVDAMEEILMV